MQCSIRENNGRTTIVVQGDLDNEQAASAFREAMNGLLVSGKRSAVIDMNYVRSINSHGIGKLLLFYKKFKNVGGELRISSPQGQVKEMLERLMLDSLFNIR